MRLQASTAALATAALALTLVATPSHAFPGKRIQGSGHACGRTLELEGVRGIVNTTSGDLEIREGKTERLEASMDDNLQDYLDAKVEDGILTLRFRSGVSVRTDAPLRFTVTLRALEELAVSGSGDTHAESLDCPRLALRLSGSGDVDLERLKSARLELRLSGSGNVLVSKLDAESVEARISGSGNVKLAGHVEEQSLRISGSGNYRAEDLGSRRARVSITGSGDSHLDVSDELEVSISGSGDLRYSGDPTLTSRHLSGSGGVSRL